MGSLWESNSTALLQTAGATLFCNMRNVVQSMLVVVVMMMLSPCFFRNSYPQFEQVDSGIAEPRRNLLYLIMNGDLLHRGHRTQKARNAKENNVPAKVNGDTTGEKMNATPFTANATGRNILRYLKWISIVMGTVEELTSVCS